MANRVANYEVKIFNDLREDKKLLVLDIDYTLFDHKTPAETGAELMRPHLHEFLTAAYKVFHNFIYYLIISTGSNPDIRLVLGLVWLIDVKGIDVAQPTWLSGCLT